MTVHLLKLAVGAASIDQLRDWVAAHARSHASGAAVRITTRSAPKRIEDVLAGGSLFWVIKGAVAARQPVVGIEPFKDADGTGRVHLVLRPDVVAVRQRPCRPFQGWRYLPCADAPDDLARDILADETMPLAMRCDLMALCLL